MSSRPYCFCFQMTLKHQPHELNDWIPAKRRQLVRHLRVCEGCRSALEAKINAEPPGAMA